MKKRLIQKKEFDILANHQRSYLRVFLLYSLGLIAVGIIVFVFGMRLPSKSETMKAALHLGGLFISSLSGFPIKELYQRKSKIKIFEFLANSIEDGNIIDEDSNKRDELLWKILEKTALTD